jgi:AcrR family transcriptional regulator
MLTSTGELIVHTYTPRQIEIIKASVKLIGRKGISALTTRNISKALGVTEPIIYRHFRNKTEILAGILSFLEESNRKIATAVLQQEAPALERIEELYMRHFSGFARTPALTSAIFSEELYYNDRVLARGVLGIMEVTKQAIMKILNEGIKNKEIQTLISPEQMAFIIMGSMRFAVTTWRLNKFKSDLVAEGKELCHLFRVLFSVRITS